MLNRSGNRWKIPHRNPRIRAALVLWLAAAFVLLGCRPTITATRAADGPSTRAYAITNAAIYTGTGNTIGKGTVVIRGGLITEVGASAKIPGDAQVIDAAGMTVYPGLFDGFTSLGLPAPATPVVQANPFGGGGRAAAAQGPPTPQQQLQVVGDPSESAADEVHPGGAPIEDARSVGITTALTSPHQGILAGQSALISLGNEEASRLVVRAPVALTIQFTGSGGFFGIYPNSLMGTIAYIRQSFYDAMHYRDEIERYERTKRGVARPEHDKRLAALLPALRGEMPVLFIANSDLDIRRALMISDEFKLHPMVEGALFSYRMADVLKHRNVPVILSVDYPKRASDLPPDVEEPLRVLRERVEMPKGPGMLAKAGVRFAFASGTLKPRDFLNNVQRAVENGLPKEDAMRALTLGAAEVFGVADQLGTIEKGKIANLIVLKGDPLAKDATVSHLFIDGDEVEVKKAEPPTREGGPRGPGRRPQDETQQASSPNRQLRD